MKTIKTYIVNLATSTARKEYMQELLGEYGFLEQEFVEAVDGRVFSQEERAQAFDDKTCYKRYGHDVKGGEVGCTLSHFKCYNKLAQSNEKFILIFEDDITIIRNLNNLDWSEVAEFMSVDEPRIMFLSGDYWYWDKKPFTRVFSAVGSYAYLINHAAAERILNKIQVPSNLADDWDVYKQLGVKLFAVHPYMVDANIADIPSEIEQEIFGNRKKNMALRYLLRTVYNGLIKRLLIHIGYFESKKRCNINTERQ